MKTTMMYTTAGNMNDTSDSESDPCADKLASEIDHEENTIDAEGESFWIGIGIGVGIGMVLVCIGSLIGRMFCCKKGRQGIHDKYLLEDEQYKL
mmetsp:Transcript_54490/g.49049  ORF Transcript_54490/g.49049 Transcript_54490/m.49049 type:complete len:94 (+) Transcript_54490:1-282(+)